MFIAVLLKLIFDARGRQNQVYWRPGGEKNSKMIGRHDMRFAWGHWPSFYLMILISV